MHDADDCKRSMIELGEAPKCKACGNLVKPDNVFFGKVMPNRFSDLIHSDVSACDLVIVLGTNLQVALVANIPDWVKRDVPRLLINRFKGTIFRTSSWRVIVMKAFKNYAKWQTGRKSLIRYTRKCIDVRKFKCLKVER